jgi:hypothetical protein
MMLDRITLGIRRSIHDEYHVVGHAKAEDAATVYLPLVDLLFRANGAAATHAEIFTLNWDTAWEAMLGNDSVFEQCQKILGSRGTTPLIADGFTDEWRRRRLYLDVAQLGHVADGPGIKLVRLHGCIMWRLERATKRVRYADATYPGSFTDEEPCILYPGQKLHEPLLEPWLSLFRLFKTSLLTAEAILVVGYSFRDAHVNEILLESMGKNPRLRVLVLTRRGREGLEGLGGTTAAFLKSIDSERVEFIKGGWPKSRSACSDRIAGILSL